MHHLRRQKTVRLLILMSLSLLLFVPSAMAFILALVVIVETRDNKTSLRQPFSREFLAQIANKTQSSPNRIQIFNQNTGIFRSFLLPGRVKRPASPWIWVKGHHQ